MKKLLYLLLLTPIIYLASCSKSSVTPQSELVLADKVWQAKNTQYRFIANSEDHKFYEKDLLCDTFQIAGNWVLNDNELRVSYMNGSLEITDIYEITEYSDEQIKFAVFSDSSLIINEVFELVEEVIRGCMDTAATNFNPAAECDFGCVFDGCMDENALNYNPNATTDDGSCCYEGGCMDAYAVNYNSDACFDDGSCTYNIIGVWTPTSVVIDSSVTVTINGIVDESSSSGTRIMTPAEGDFEGDIEFINNGNMIHQGETMLYTYSNNILTVETASGDGSYWTCSFTENTLSLLRIIIDTAWYESEILYSIYFTQTIHCTRNTSGIVNTNVSQRMGNINHNWFVKPKFNNILK